MLVKDRPDYKDGATFKQPEAYAYVIVGDGKRAGTIKSIPYRRETHSPILSAENTGDGYIRIRVHAAYARRGWKLVDDAYKAESDLTAKVGGKTLKRDECQKRFHDYMRLMRGAGNARIRHKEMMNNIIPGFPDEMLPKYCRELAAGRDPLSGMYDPLSGNVVDANAPAAST